MKKTWSRKEIDELLRSNDLAVERAILRLYQLQTEDEANSSKTKHKNNRGFSASDAKAGSLFAQFLMGLDSNNVRRWTPKSLNHPIAARFLMKYVKSGNPIDRARKIALRHSKQLVEIANNQ